LLSAYPDLAVAEQENALLSSAVDLGVVGPDNDFGHGRLDLLAAYQWAASPPPATPTPTATPDPDVNLALNAPVVVSSSQDLSHGGAMAVDGDLATAWQTAKAVGKNKLPSEWIAVDLGSSVSIGQVVLEWGDNYAIEYVIQVSEDNSNWTTVYSTASGDGGNDTITLSPTSARYLRMDSSAWSSGSLRNWLKEFQVYVASGPVPTATPTPVPTPTPGEGSMMHVGDLDGSSSSGARNRWTAAVVITVHDAGDNPVSGASVNGTWSDGVSGSDVCVTDATGGCSNSRNNIKSNVSSVVFTIDGVSHPTLSYQPSANHDSDGDSDGTSVTVSKP
jgi:hypothetical protein